MDNQSASKWKLYACAMIIALFSVNVLTQFSFDNIMINMEQAEESMDCLEDDCIVNLFLVAISSSCCAKENYAYIDSKACYTNPYFSKVYPPPEFLISM